MFKKIAKKIIFIAPKQLCELFNFKDWGVEILPNDTDLDKLEFDYFTHTMDAMEIFETRPDSIPYPERYLEVPQNLIDEYREKYINKNDKFKIGIASGDYRSLPGYERDIPFMEIFPFAKIEGCELYSIQVGETSLQLTDLPQDVEITDLGKTFSSFVDTACAIENMDLMISTDNVILNLAGALGKQTLGIYNKFNEYRWFKLTGDDVGWYKSVRPFVLKRQSEWAPTIEKVCAFIKEEILPKR